MPARRARLAAAAFAHTAAYDAAIGSWFGGWVDAVIQRLTEINSVLPTLPILILVGTFYSRSIWVILGVGTATGLLIGFLAVLAENSKILTSDTRNFLFVGILGAFTTFSTFGYESMVMLRNGATTAFVLNIGLQLGLGLLAVWLGINAGHLLQKVIQS